MNRLSIAIIILFLTSGLHGKDVIKKSELQSLLNEQQQIVKLFPGYYKESHKNDKKAIKTMKIFMNTFGKNQNKLKKCKNNNKDINKRLLKITEEWNVGYNLSKAVKFDGSIASTMSRIEKDIKELRKLYSKTY